MPGSHDNQVEGGGDVGVRPLRLLVLGGTQFVGRHLVQAALDRGHVVTLFNRGITNAELFDGRVEKVRGDRDADLSALSGGTWDCVVDVAAYHPSVTQRSIGALAGAVRRYLFVSTVSVYADQSVPPVEGAAVLELDDLDDRSPGSYGARKAACERVVVGALGQRATVVRPGLIVGPHDPTDRFGYWPRRIAAGGRVLAPGEPSDPLQFIDVRDLADFMLHLIETDTPGTFNATGRTITFGDFLAACQEACAATAQLIWVTSDQLLASGLDPWMGVPLWIGDPGWKAANRVDITRALRAGLRLRDLTDTVRAVSGRPPSGPVSNFGSVLEEAVLGRVHEA